MTCQECLMCTHCRYAIEQNGTCGNFMDKNRFVKVVRCTECIHHRLTSIEGILYCMMWDKYVAPTHYCSQGERERFL